MHDMTVMEISRDDSSSSRCCFCCQMYCESRHSCQSSFITGPAVIVDMSAVTKDAIERLFAGFSHGHAISAHVPVAMQHGMLQTRN